MSDPILSHPTPDVAVDLGATLVGQIDLLGDWGLLATDVHLNVTAWNRWLALRTGQASTGTLGRPLFELYPELSTRRIDRYYRQALAGQPVVLSQRFHQYILPMRPTIPNTGMAHMQQVVRIVPVMDGSTVRGTLTLIEDVTERVIQETGLRDLAGRQAVIAAVARSALAGREAVDIAREVIEHLVQTLAVDMGEVLEWLPERMVWTLLAGVGWTKPNTTVFDAVAATRASPALTNGRPLQLEDVATNSITAADAHLRKHNVTSGLMIRIPGRGDQAFGLLAGYHRTRRKFSADEVEFAQTLADVLGVAVERRQLEGELRLRVLELAEADRRKDEFLAMLAHELRNPLAPVRNGLQILQIAQDKPDVVLRTREMIDRQIQHLSRLVDDLLDVSRITRGKVELRKQPVDLAEVTGGAIDAVRPLIESRRHQLTVTHHGVPSRVNADATRLAQVLGNLLTNAAKYTDEGGQITLSLERDGDEAVIRVRDNGAGISPEMKTKVFDLFTQVEGTLDRSQGGLGIGLTLVKTLVELHGGYVEVFSEGAGKGSEFTVRLPALADEALDSPTKSVDHIPVPIRRIIVVDDNQDAAESLAMILQLGGHEVRTAHNGMKALELMLDFSPEVVLLDIGLPGMTGYEVAQKLRESPATRRCLIVAMTGYGQATDRERSRQAGFDYHLVKPLDLEEVRRLLAAGPAGEN